MTNTHTHSWPDQVGILASVWDSYEGGAPSLVQGLMPHLVAGPSMTSVFYVINEELEVLLGSTIVIMSDL